MNHCSDPWRLSLARGNRTRSDLVFFSSQMVRLVEAGFTSFDGADHYGMSTNSTPILN
jgi:hypothetical protein